MCGDAVRLEDYALDDGYGRPAGRVWLTGIRALVRLMLEQRRLDRARGLRTAGFVSGYRGSPLAGFDKELERARQWLEAEDVRFEPAINEALAATACMGAQQVEACSDARVDGVFALWYGKGPGVDWAGDAIKHANAYGTSPHGGVLAVAGDDHGAVSSTMSHQSDHTFAAWSLPVLHPASVEDYLPFGLYGFALSRFTGAWVGFKAISETVESARAVELPGEWPQFREPKDFLPPPGGLHFRWNDPPSVAIEHRLLVKLEAARRFAGANPGIVDRMVVRSERARLGIVTVGKAHGDVMEALRLLGFEDASSIARLGLRIYKVGQSFPLEPTRIRNFARGLETLFVVEEKRPLVESQIREILYPLAQRPQVIGKRDRDERELLPASGELRPHRIAPALAREIGRLWPDLDLSERLARIMPRESAPPPLRRTPWFCPGCPHNRSTVVPEGSVAFGGIGCHIMATWMGRETYGTTHMGGEGANWIGLAPYLARDHVFQNLGDGTYFHSGLLAIRQAVASRARMTYKILFNDAVAMTGGQKMEVAGLTVPRLTRQLQEEGVGRIAVVTDEPQRYRGNSGLAPGVTVHHRAELLRVEEELRAFPGVSVLVFDQTCAAEKRRRRRRRQWPDPPRRPFINELVCEGCGDCARISNCLSVVPVETEFGTRRQIDPSSCNKDFSCLEGFCPSFVTVEGGRLRRAAVLDPKELETRCAQLARPRLPEIGDVYEILVTGIGGTGVLTLGAIVAVAAFLEGRAASLLDFTGLAQKGGAVLSHIRLARGPDLLHQARIEPRRARVVLACDPVVALSEEAAATIAEGRTRIAANRDPVPTADALRRTDWRVDGARLLEELRRRGGQVEGVDAGRLAEAFFGDSLHANLLLLGFAWQRGMIPVSETALLRAIALNGVAVEANRRAFALGRLVAADPSLLASKRSGEAKTGSEDLESRIHRLAAELEAYQNASYARRYLELVRAVEARERALLGAAGELTGAVAESLFRLMAHKDEYEVARLFTDGRFQRMLAQRFEGDYRLRFHMAPPLLGFLRDASGRPRKLSFGPWLLPVLRLLARLRFLRGTPFDPFGWTSERRRARALLREYEATLRALLSRLGPHNHAIAVEIARLPEEVRGFGPVREKAILRYRARRGALLESFARQPRKTHALAAE